MNITIVSFLLGILLLALPLYLLHVLQVPMIGKVLRAFGRAAVMLVALGVCLYLVFHWNHWAVNLLVVFLMAAVGMWLVVRHARLGTQMLVPIGAGLLAALIVIGATQTLSHALSVYYRSLIHHDELYYYIIGNGASQAEALSWYVRRSLQATVLPHVKQMSAFGLTMSPLVVWAMLLSGSSVVEAVAVQLLVLVAGFTASVVALVVALFVARRYSFDGYGRLKAENPKL